MAIHAHSTTAPIVQPRLLRGGGTVPCRVLTTNEVIALTATPPVDDPRSTDDLLEEIRRTIEGQEASLNSEDCPELLPESLLSADVPHGVARAHMSTTEDLGSADRCSTSSVDAACHGDTQPLLPRHGNHPDEIGVVESRPDHFRLVDESHSLHMRRELHQALDHGFALLDALDLPPLALDVIDDAIATLDALDDDVDLEDDDTAEAEPDDEEGGDLADPIHRGADSAC